MMKGKKLFWVIHLGVTKVCGTKGKMYAQYQVKCSESTYLVIKSYLKKMVET